MDKNFLLKGIFVLPKFQNYHHLLFKKTARFNATVFKQL
jgi:hypothetical protein